MSLPVHRWYRYSAGFSADWVRWLVRERRGQTSSYTVLDPFCGVGTSLLACAAENTTCLGFESHPFVNRIANAKLHGIHSDLSCLRSLFQRFADCAANILPEKIENTSPLLRKCYHSDSLSLLIAMRNLFLAEFDAKTPESELLWLTLTSILRSCSGVGTAQWQYVLPNKSKAEVQEPFLAFSSKAMEILKDVEFTHRAGWSDNSRILLTDAREPQVETHGEVDLVVSSPPYPNNYDYADATRLEMTFWGEINGWGDLQNSVRKHLIRSCSQHAAAEKLVLEDLLSDSIVAPIHDELSSACRTLSEVRETKGGRKTYHTMAAAYFRDIGLVFKSLRSLCRAGAVVCFVIGDSAPYGVYLKVDDWLGKLAVAAGFKSYTFEKIRDRNTKWKNRKHRVPLKEGRLWIEG
ncbi:MAG: DNA modification methylase [Candidatus Omnitrophota bacterium]|nr:MAG: DNA modification methylase [Candidatus Omnitrophota bacterium]